MHRPGHVCAALERPCGHIHCHGQIRVLPRRLQFRRAAARGRRCQQAGILRTTVVIARRGFEIAGREAIRIDVERDDNRSVRRHRREIISGGIRIIKNQVIRRRIRVIHKGQSRIWNKRTIDF